MLSSLSTHHTNLSKTDKGAPWLPSEKTLISQVLQCLREVKDQQYPPPTSNALRTPRPTFILYM
jgi:hypothetical protein